VVAKIVNARRAKVDLAEDLAQISRRLAKMNEFVQTSNADHLRLPYLLELLKLQHQSSFLHFMNGLEQALDIYLDHKSDASFAKVQAEISTLARRDHGFNLLGNGQYLCQGARLASDLDPSSPLLRDSAEFARCYQPVVDEQALVPPQLGLVRKLYGRTAQREARTSAARACAQVLDYSCMRASFLNLDDEQRAFLASNFQQLEESVTAYLVLQGLIPDPSASRAGANGAKQTIHISRPVDILQARVEFLGLKVEARHLQRVLMSWAICGALPDQTASYLEAQQLVREQTMLKVLLERDVLTEQYYAAKEGRRDGGEPAGSVRAAA